jgi:hypothetical protein
MVSAGWAASANNDAMKAADWTCYVLEISSGSGVRRTIGGEFGWLRVWILNHRPLVYAQSEIGEPDVRLWRLTPTNAPTSLLLPGALTKLVAYPRDHWNPT